MEPFFAYKNHNLIFCVSIINIITKYLYRLLKLFNTFKYIISSIAYGVLIAVVLLLLVPQLKTQWSGFKLFQVEPNTQAPLSYAKGVSRATPAVVNIYSEEIQPNSIYGSRPQKSTRLGSGVIMTSDGYILTNFHVVQNADLILVLQQNGQRHPAELIGYDIYTDLAVLKVNAKNLPVIPQKADQKSLTGDVVLAIGNPLNLGQTVTQGIISATGRNGLSNTSYLEFLQMDAAINEGNSGGALINTNGDLVGINSRKFINPKLNIQGIFFAVPYQLAHKVMKNIIANGRVIRGWLGIEASMIMTNVKGFMVDNVLPNSPAQKAGLQSKDIIYQIGGTPITSITQALDLVAETKPGTTLIFKVERNRKQFDLPVTIIEKPAL